MPPKHNSWRAASITLWPTYLASVISEDVAVAQQTSHCKAGTTPNPHRVCTRTLHMAHGGCQPGIMGELLVPTGR